MTEDEIRLAKANEELLKKRLISVQFCEWAGLLQDGRAVICGPFERMTITEEQWGTTVSVFFIIKGYDTQERPFHMEIYNPDGSLYGQFDTDVAPRHPTDEDREYGTVISQLNLSFTKEGRHWFEISYDGVLLGRYGFTVSKMVNAMHDVKIDKIDFGDSVLHSTMPEEITIISTHRKQLAALAMHGSRPVKSRDGWRNTVGKYEEELALNRILDRGAAIREAERAEK